LFHLLGRRGVFEDLEHALENPFVDQSAAEQWRLGDLGAHRHEATPFPHGAPLRMFAQLAAEFAIDLARQPPMA
jgi:hypothetical protein